MQPYAAHVPHPSDEASQPSWRAPSHLVISTPACVACAPPVAACASVWELSLTTPTLPTACAFIRRTLTSSPVLCKGVAARRQPCKAQWMGSPEPYSTAHPAHPLCSASANERASHHHAPPPCFWDTVRAV
jgi:hypothetical protein